MKFSREGEGDSGGEGFGRLYNVDDLGCDGRSGDAGGEDLGRFYKGDDLGCVNG